MNLTELAPGFAYWTAPHPEWEPDENWPEDVLCAYYEAVDGTVLIDPLVPRGREDEFWQFLDVAVERRGLPVRVLLTRRGMRATRRSSRPDTTRASGRRRRRAGKGRC